MPAHKLKQFLDDNHVKYISLRHSQAFTAQEIAESAHISGKDLAKTVIVTIDGKDAMAVLPASRRVKPDVLKDAVGASTVELGDEARFKNEFPGCEVGAMPPFGNLYGMDVYVDPTLAEDDEIAFNAGSHTELVQLAYADFARLAQPKVVTFS